MPEDVFAFGDSKINGVRCPVRSAGRSVSGKLLTVAERYDEVVQNRVRHGEGTIPANVAERCWNEAIVLIREQADSYLHEDPEHSSYLREVAIKAEFIGEKVF